MGNLRGRLRARIALGAAIAASGLGFAASSARAAVAYTGEAVAGTTTATAYGYVDTQGKHTTWAFAYGTSSKLGSWSKTTTLRRHNSVVMAVTQLSGLKPGTTYRYRLFALPSGSSGHPDWAHASWGQESTFRTLGLRHGRRGTRG